jgi:hypothetical protein
MANWSNPLLTSTYTNFLTEVKDRDTDLALQFDGTTSSNIPTNAIRWNSSVNRWQKWSGSAWGELTGTYALTGLSTTGNATIGGTLGSGAITSTGSVSGTALIPTGSTVPATGVYLSSANTIGLATSSIGRVFVDASGEFGVGTATPGTSVDVTLAAASATIGNVRIAPSVAGQARFHLFNGGAVAEWLFGQKTSTDHSFKLSKSVAGSETDYLTVDISGRLGIGTTSPGYTLHVNGSCAVAGDKNFRLGESTFTYYYDLGRDGTTGAFVFNGNQTGSVAYSFRKGGTSLVDIDNSGRVGIGTSSPAELLHVANGAAWVGAPTSSSSGTIAIYGNGNNGTIEVFAGNNPSIKRNLLLCQYGGSVGIGTSSPGAALHVGNDGDFWLSSSVSTVEEKNTISWRIEDGSQGASISTYREAVTNAPHAILFGTRNSAGGIAERLRITSAGFLGHNTTSPAAPVHFALPTTSASIGNVYVAPSTAGQARFHLYNGGSTAEWLFGQRTSTDHEFRISTQVAGSETERLRIGTAGQIGIAGANYGTSGQVLTSNGSGSAPSWTTITALTAATAASATGTAVDFTSIPSSVKRITVIIDSVSLNSTDTIAVQLGDSGGIETTGYTCGLAWTGQSTGSSGSSSTFALATGAASDVLCGHAVITKISGDTWILSSTICRENDDLVFVSGGSKTLSATLDRIRITTPGGAAAFDAGTINIMYE